MALVYRLPQLVGVQAAGKDAALADYRNGFKRHDDSAASLDQLPSGVQLKSFEAGDQEIFCVDNV